MSLPILSSPCVRKKRDHAKRVQPVLPANVFQEMTKKQTGDCNFRSLLVKKINLGKPPHQVLHKPCLLFLLRRRNEKKGSMQRFGGQTSRCIMGDVKNVKYRSNTNVFTNEVTV